MITFTKLITQIKKRKITFGIVLFMIVGIGYWSFGKVFSDDDAARYVSAQVQKGTLIVSITGSGQVNTLDKLDIKARVAGEIIDLKIKDNQEVKAGALLLKLSSRDAQKAILDAQTNLADAQLTLKNLAGKTQESLDKSWSDSLDALSDALLDFSESVKNLKPVLTESSYSGAKNYTDYYLSIIRLYNPVSEIFSFWEQDGQTRYSQIEKEFKEIEKNYLGLNLDSSKEKIEAGLEKTFHFSQSLLDLTRQSANVVKKYQDILNSENIIPPIATTTTESQYNQLTSSVLTIANHRNSLSTAKDKLSEAKEALEKEEISIQAQQLLVRQKEFDLEDAKEKLTQHFISSPADGIISSINVKMGDSISANTIAATLVTKQKVAEISLNEIDAAQVKVDQKATLTFDAVPDLTITGQVVEIDAVGTASQGVVTYNMKIAFDTQDERIKPSMSVSAAIVTEAKQDVLLVPNSAVKYQGGVSYVEIIGDDDKDAVLVANVSGAILKNTPRRQIVEVGAASDEFTEIVSGLSQGDVIVTRTIQPTTQSAQIQNSSVRVPGLPTGSGGGSFRTISP